MKKTTALGIIAFSVLAAAACSEDGDNARDNNNNNNNVAGNDMTGTAGSTGGTGGTGTAGSTAGTSSTGTNNYGSSFSIDGGNVVGTAEAVGGNIFPVSNGANGDYVGDTPPDATASHIATFAATANEICMSGRIREVPGGATPTYDTHWGVQAGMNLNVPGTAVASGTTADAGAGAGADAGLVDGGVVAATTEDAGGGGDDEAVPVPWDAGSVLGFSFTLTGTEMPPAMRFLGAPSEPDISAPGVDDKGDLNFCAGFVPFDGNNVDILFTDILDRCWGDEVRRAPFITPLDSVSWQIQADTGAASNFSYDFCIGNIRAIIP